MYVTNRQVILFGILRGEKNQFRPKSRRRKKIATLYHNVGHVLRLAVIYLATENSPKLEIYRQEWAQLKVAGGILISHR